MTPRETGSDGTSRFPARPGKRLTVYVGARHRAQHRPLVIELIRRARRAKLAGATVFQGQSGFGHSGAVHKMHLVTEDAPERVVLVDSPEAIDAFVAREAELLQGVLVLVDDVEIVDL